MELKSIPEFDESVNIDVYEEVCPLASFVDEDKYALYPTNPCMAWDLGKAGYSQPMVFSYSEFCFAIREPENRYTTK